MGRMKLRVVGSVANGAQEAGDPWIDKCHQWPRRTFEAIGRSLLLRLGIAKINPVRYPDEVTGEQLTINRSARYLIVSYGARSYYFDPLTGELEGTGSLLCRG